MSNVFEFTPKELEQAHKVLSQNGIVDKAKRDERIVAAQTTGQISIFSYGSLLFQALTDQKPKEEKASVKGYAARFHQAIDMYGGEEWRRKLTLALEPSENKTTHGLIQTVEIESAAAFLDYYKNLSTRENPVNNPHYSFSDTVEARTEGGESVTCITCLSDLDGPLYTSGKLSEDEIAVILAHTKGPRQLLDSEAFRLATEGKIKYLPLQPHQQTGAAYAFHCLAAYNALKLPNTYLERIVDKINKVRGRMSPLLRKGLEAKENKCGDKEAGLAPRCNHGSNSKPGIVEAFNQFKKYEKANAHLNDILMANQAFVTWGRELN